MSDNAMSGANQQERLIKRGWVTGFVDGEGCFSIGLIRNPRIGRQGCKTGYQVFHEFVVTQGAKSVECLNELHEFFGVGQVLINQCKDNHREHIFRYVVRKRCDLQEVIIPFFQEHSLHSAKQYDFQKFAQCVTMIDAGHHLTLSGLADIVQIVETMNRQKPRQELLSILRDYTPDASDMR
jgi:hypothetical protein